MTITGATDQTIAERNGKAVEGERGRAVDAAISAIEKQFGRGSIMRLGDRASTPIDVIPTGSVALDLALGVGGIPRGRMTEIFGPEASGKTTLCQHILAEAQRAGGVVAFIDVEHALDPAYARACGVNVDELLVSQPDTGEQALEIAETLIRSGGLDCVVIDSVAALVPRAEIEGEMGDSFVGIQARLMSQALRKLTGAVSRSNTALVFTNQLREKIGVMFGNPETTPGGRALKFYASVRLDIRRIETIKSATESIARGCASRSSRTRWRRPSGSPSSTSCTPRGSAARAASSTSARRWGSSPRPARGSTTATSGSARDARLPRSSCGKTPTSPRPSSATSGPRSATSRSRWRASRRPSRPSLDAGDAGVVAGGPQRRPR